jgi:phage shock protein PspC (stress-responsive transcriptional regulator)
MTCARCLKDLEEGSSFCRHCGAAVGRAPQVHRLVRLPREGRLGGVCAGLAAYFDTDVTLVRLAWIILSIVPGLFLGGVIAYAACWVLLPVGAPGDRLTYRGMRLTRSNADRQLAGVCGGLAEYLGVDSTIVRIVSVVLAIYPGAFVGGAIAYLIGWLIIPEGQTPMPVDTTRRNAESLP